VSECLAELDADPRYYTTPIAMDDMNEVRVALGYDKINLWGASYGTRAGLVYLRRHPSTVRSAVLDGVAPTTMTLPRYFARDGQRALDLLFEHCAAEPACAGSFPDLSASLDRLLAELEKEPARGELQHPRSGAPATLEINREVFAGGLRSFLYSTTLSRLIPVMIQSALEANFRPFVASSMAMNGGGAAGISVGMMLSVLCAEDLSRFDAGTAAADAEGTFLGSIVDATFREGCALWPTGEVSAAYGDPIASDTPVLLLSGQLDPVTPPTWADEALEHLSHGRHIIAPNTGHGASLVGCVPELIAEFYDDADPAALDATCLDSLSLPSFFQNLAGPAP